MEKVVKVNLNSIDSVKDFCSKNYKFDGMLTLKHDRYVIDAKSIMGIFSLDLTKDLDLYIEGKTEEAINTFVEAIKGYIVE